MYTSGFYETNEDLIDSLKNTYWINEKVGKVMKSVDRAHFVNKNPYQDAPQSIGYGVTISAPHMHAAALELLYDFLQEGMTSLDIGSGDLLKSHFIRDGILDCLHGENDWEKRESLWD
jgi:protein-L-isoaspartate(D-aspartate) O-methyltransferase